MPAKRWLFGRIRTMQDVERALYELQKILEEDQDTLNVLAQNGGGGAFSPAGIYANLSGQQGSCALDEHIEFDTLVTDESGGQVTLSSGTGQQNGIFTVSPGLWYAQAQIYAALSSSGAVPWFQFYDVTGSPVGLGAPSQILVTNSGTSSRPNAVQGVWRNESQADVELRLAQLDAGSIASIESTATHIAIVKIGEAT